MNRRERRAQKRQESRIPPLTILESRIPPLTILDKQFAGVSAKDARRREIQAFLRRVDVEQIARAPHGSLAGDNRICLSAIIRENNPSVVARSLLSARPFIQQWAIVDTGSTAAVKQAIREVLAGIPGTLEEKWWPGSFATARNWALDLARESGADLAMFVDADDFVCPMSRDMRPLPRITTRTAVTTQLFVDGVGDVVLFARLDASHRWLGDVHEHLEPRDLESLRIADYTLVVTCEGWASQDLASKYSLYRAMLRSWLREHPDDGWAWAHLGAAVALEGDLVEARECRDRARALIPPGYPMPVTFARLERLIAP
jgi:hypothetical protein